MSGAGVMSAGGEVQRRGRYDAVVVANVPLCREHFRLVVRVPQFPATRAGQFIQIACRNLELDYSPETEFEWRPGELPGAQGVELMGPLAFLRRPFSLAGRRDTAEGAELEVIHRVVGVGTQWLSRLAPGEAVQVIGPLGNTFTHPPDGGIAVLVGGGVGIPPMLYLASELVGRKAVAFSGAVTRELLPLTITGDAPWPGAESFDPLYNIAELARHGVPAVISTDDGSYGYKGYVTGALERYLDAYMTDNADRGRMVIYTCGPEGMMKRVAEIAARRMVECQVAVERAMACGMGTCQSCCIRVKKADPALPPLAGKEWCYRLACTDGPVFRGGELLW